MGGFSHFAIDKILYGILPDYFSPVELSPVSTIGANAVLTSLNAKIVLSTIRNVEVVGDPTLIYTDYHLESIKTLRICVLFN